MISTTGIIMGKGAPNRSKTKGIVQCAIVLSPDFGFIRIWPLHPETHQKIKIWSVVSLELEKTSNDSRDESYRLVSVHETGQISDRNEKEKILNRCCLKSGSSDPQDFQNENKKSIYLVRPEQIYENSIVRNDVDPFADTEYGVEDGWVEDQNKRKVRAVIKWKSMQGKIHTMGVVSQEAAEWFRKKPEYAGRIFENYCLMDPLYDKWFLCGNQKDHRTAWVLVHIFRLKKTQKIVTPNFWPMFDGVGGDWPYLKQGAGNVKTADSGQMEFLFTSTTSSTILTDCLGNMATMSFQSYANTAIGGCTTNEKT